VESAIESCQGIMCNHVRVRSQTPSCGVTSGSVILTCRHLRCGNSIVSAYMPVFKAVIHFTFDSLCQFSFFGKCILCLSVSLSLCLLSVCA